MKRTFGMLLALCMALSLAVCGSTSALAREDPVIVGGSGRFTVEEAVERTLAYEECQNLAGKHEFYHSALMHQEELENIWVTEEPWIDSMSWTNNTQFMYGKENVYGFYCGVKDEKANWLNAAIALDDQGRIENTEDWKGTGILWYHMLMTPVIEVARDCQTACGLWQSFGTVTQPGGGEMGAQWTCEDYTMVFARQSDGEWRIWHLRTFVHFYTNVDNHWYEQNMATQGNDGNQPAGVGVLGGPSGEPSGDMTPPGQGQYAEMGEWNRGYDLYKVPQQLTIPEPYDTWADIEDSFYWGNQPVDNNVIMEEFATYQDYDFSEYRTN